MAESKPIELDAALKKAEQINVTVTDVTRDLAKAAAQLQELIEQMKQTLNNKGKKK